MLGRVRLVSDVMTSFPLSSSVSYPTSNVIKQLVLDNKKLSCRRDTARCFVSLNISLSHSRSFEMTLLACASSYQYLFVTVSSTVSDIFSVK